MSDPDDRPFYSQVDSVRKFLKQGGPRSVAMQELHRISLAMRHASNRPPLVTPTSQDFPEGSTARAAMEANERCNEQERERQEWARINLLTQPYEGWGR